MSDPSRPYPPADYPPNQPPSGDYPPGSGAPVNQPPVGQSVAIALPSVKPYMSYFLLGFTVLMFIGQELGIYLLGQDVLYQWGAMYGPAIQVGQYWRLITPVFLHLSLVHIAVNMYSLYILGPGLERQYGHYRFLALYLIAGFAGNALSFYFSTPFMSSAGASTALFGLIGAEGVFVYHNRKFFGNRSGGMLRNIIFIAVLNLLFGFYTASPIANANVPVVDNWGHIGGLVAGLLFAWFAGPIWQVEGVYPNLRVVDKRETLQVQLAAVGVTVLFATVAFLRILRR